MAHSGTETPYDIPPAFFRCDDPPLPPPGDPHRREWPGHGNDREPSPQWMRIALPAGIIFVGIILLLLKMVLLLTLVP
jgi:hypothetical protein